MNQAGARKTAFVLAGCGNLGAVQVGMLIESQLPYRRLEDAAVPCHVVATDVLDSTEVILSTAEATTALLASTAIPAVFPAATIAGRPLMDGGIANNTPISVAIALGATRE